MIKIYVERGIVLRNGAVKGSDEERKKEKREEKRKEKGEATKSKLSRVFVLSESERERCVRAR